jgi:death-on-curing protein
VTEYLEVDPLLALAELFLDKPAEVRDLGLLASAAARPAASVLGEGAYPDLWSKAAALLHSLANNHALVDGNKRLAWVGTRAFLALNGIAPRPVDVDGAERFMVAVASGRLTEVDPIARHLRRLVE